MKRILLLVVVVILVGSPDELMALEEIDIYLGGYVQVGMPSDSDQGIRINGRQGRNSSIGEGIGGGIKIGLFPDFTRRMVGIELEYSGHSGDIQFQSLGNMSQSKANLIVLHSMVNLLVRYPHKKVRPYIGIGAGSSSGVLINAEIADRKNKDSEGAIALGHQFLAGLQVNVSEKIFLFGEYKYVSANFHWKQLSLDFRSQNAVGGIGFLF